MSDLHSSMKRAIMIQNDLKYAIDFKETRDQVPFTNKMATKMLQDCTEAVDTLVDDSKLLVSLTSNRKD